MTFLYSHRLLPHSNIIGKASSRIRWKQTQRPTIRHYTNRDFEILISKWNSSIKLSPLEIKYEKNEW